MDTRAIAVRKLTGACRAFRQDLEALPDDAFDRGFGGIARTVADIVYEVNFIHDYFGMLLRGEEPTVHPPEDGWMRAPEDKRTKGVVLAEFDAAASRIIAATEALTREQMEAAVPSSRGETTPFERVLFLTQHLWYHCGQLNYVQTLLGDAAWHWS